MIEELFRTLRNAFKNVVFSYILRSLSGCLLRRVGWKIMSFFMSSIE